VGYEGCGSIAYGELFGPVKRSQSVMVEALGVDGKPFKLSAKGMLARVIQHENDHLNGVVFLDKITDMRKLISRDYFIKHKPK
jgi:peptide deformylase